MSFCVYLVELYHCGYNHPYGPLVTAIGADDDVTKLAAWHRVTRISQYFSFLYDSGSHRTLSSEVRRPIIPERPFVVMTLSSIGPMYYILLPSFAFLYQI